jgi:hypothetical protein
MRNFFLGEFFSSVLVLFSISSNSQDLSAYHDYRNYFYAFDKGEFRQLEYQPVKSFQIGGSSVAYIDNTNEFRIYSEGQKFHITYGGTLNYYMTDYLVAYRVGNVLSVFQNQHFQNLSYYCSIFAINDSVIGYFDGSNYNFSVFYNGNSIDLESSMLEPPKSMKTGSNTVAYVNQSNFFKVFYQGNIFSLDNVAPLTFQAGGDVVAYVDDYDQNFHLFYKGDTARIETFAPDSFKVGFGTLAYIDNLGNFRVFYNGATRRLLSFRPDFFQVKGNIVLYAYNNSLAIFYKGKVYTLENYIPSGYQIANDGIAYVDISGRLKLFFKGEVYNVSYELINNYQLIGNVLTYGVGINTTKFFWNGKNY